MYPRGSVTPPLEHLLVADWNVYMAQTLHAHNMRAQRRFMGERKATAANVALLSQMVAWCRERHLEPRHWLFWLFQRTGWKFPPKFQPGYLMSPTAHEKFQKSVGRSNTAFFRRRLGAAAAAEMGQTVYDPNRDTTPSLEALKQRYAESGQHQRCMDETLLHTLGFHPASAPCQACPLRAECALRLEAMAPFPILALRAGQITSAEAERMAQAHG